MAAPTSSDLARTAIIRQDVQLYVTEVAAGDNVTHALAQGRHAWIQVVRGDIDVNGAALRQGDGVAVSDERELVVSGTGEVLIFDLP